MGAPRTIRASTAAIAAVLAIAASVLGVGAGAVGPASAASGGSPFLVVAVAPLTGALAPFASQIGPISQAAATVLNKHGGIDGHKVEVQVINDNSDPTTGAAHLSARLASSPKPDLIVPGGDGSEGEAYVPIANASKILSVGEPNETTLNNPAKYPYYFMMPPSQKLPSEQMASYFKSKGWTKVAMLTSTDAYGRTVSETMSAAAKRAGITLDSGTYNDTTLTVTPQLQQLQGDHPQALYIDSETATLGVILQDRYKLGWTTIPAIGDQTAAGDPISQQVVGKPTGKNYFIQVTKVAVYNAHPSPAEQDFLAAVKKAKETSVPVSFVCYVYDTLMVVAQAAKQAKSISTPAMATALEHLHQPADPLWVTLSSYSWSPGTHAPASTDGNWTVVPASKLVDGQFDAPGSTR